MGLSSQSGRDSRFRGNDRENPPGPLDLGGKLTSKEEEQLGLSNQSGRDSRFHGNDSVHEKGLDLGFRVFKLAKSNFKVWEGHISPGDSGPLETGHSGSEHLKDQGSTDTPAVGVKGLNGHSLKEQGSPDKQVEEQIQMHLEEYLDPHSTTEDLLYEILLKTGYPLTIQVKTLTLANKKVYSIENHAFLMCLEQKITPQLIKEMALLRPARVVCLDKGFGQNDQLKTNAYETFKTHGVTTFNTV